MEAKTWILTAYFTRECGLSYSEPITLLAAPSKLSTYNHLGRAEVKAKTLEDYYESTEG